MSNFNLSEALDKYSVMFDVPRMELEAKYHTWISGLGRDPVEWDVKRTAEEASPYNAEAVIRKHAIMPMRAAAAMHWARAGGRGAKEVMTWFTNNTKKDYAGNDTVSMADLAAEFPIVLPRNEDGLIDLHLLDDPGTLNSALIYDQEADIAYASTWGGDDNWFDYLPDGIHTLQLLQSEDWQGTFNFVLNNIHTFGMPYTGDQDRDEQIQTTWDNARERYADVFLMDVTTPLIYALAIERDENDPNIYILNKEG